jgi:hypothetical protein
MEASCPDELIFFARFNQWLCFEEWFFLLIFIFFEKQLCFLLHGWAGLPPSWASE